MPSGQGSPTGGKHEATLVLYCLVRRQDAEGGPIRFLLVHKQGGQPSFPPTKFRPGEDLYHALACHWVASQSGGARVLHRQDIDRILAAGDGAFNLRVADPYFAYHKQGLGFTWSFFTPKDRQDVHVHGLPAVEIYGVIEGRLQLWHKPMNQRGVWTWQCRTLGRGDWVEVEPLECHFACWAEPEGLGIVVKAAGSGELAGVGKLGVAGKTTCKDCNVQNNCIRHPGMSGLIEQYSLPFEQRDYDEIARLVEENATVYGPCPLGAPS